MNANTSRDLSLAECDQVSGGFSFTGAPPAPEPLIPILNFTGSRSAELQTPIIVITGSPSAQLQIHVAPRG